MHIIRRIIAVLFALVMMASFYVYAVMREDEETKRTDQWVVADETAGLSATGGIQTDDPVLLARAMGCAVPLPATLLTGKVEDLSYHGYYARKLTATDGQVWISGVRPPSAAPLLRGEVVFTSYGNSMFGHPLLEAEDTVARYAFLVTDQAAFLIESPVGAGSAAYHALTLTSP
ncbi:MAG: hypothetical protein GX916_04025 [Clostridiales bacterium]|nr:hypothetical protein [Clostridiales bacterium]